MPFFDISLPNFSLSALAFSLSHLLQNKKGPFCIVLPEENTAFELWENFKTLQSSLSDFCKTPALWFPAWNPSLFSTAATSILVREARLKTLLSLQQSSSVLVFGAFPAFSQKLTSYSFLKNVSFSLHQGQEYDLTEIQSRLFSLGYESRSFVEEKGTFAFRSDRLDLWTPFHQTPFRFEFWGPALEGLFPFDPKTQRKTDFQSVASLWVPPAKELPLSQKEFVSLKKHLKTYSDKQGISRKFRDPIFTLLDRQLFLDTMEAWVPFLFSEKDHFFFTLPSPATWVLIKKDQIEKKFISFLENEKTNHALFKAQNRLLPSPERVFFSLKTFSSYIQENTVYQTYQFLSKTLPPPLTSRHSNRFLF